MSLRSNYSGFIWKLPKGFQLAKTSAVLEALFRRQGASLPRNRITCSNKNALHAGSGSSGTSSLFWGHGVSEQKATRTFSPSRRARIWVQYDCSGARWAELSREHRWCSHHYLCGLKGDDSSRAAAHLGYHCESKQLFLLLNIFQMLPSVVVVVVFRDFRSNSNFNHIFLAAWTSPVTTLAK